MKLKDFDFNLPEELIAQRPLEKRASSRLMVVRRSSDSIEHRMFTDMAGYFRPGDILVVNDTRVIPARLTGRKKTGGRVEVLLVRPLGNKGVGGAGPAWNAIIGNSKGLAPGRSIELDGGATARILGKNPDGLWEVSIEGATDVGRLLEEHGSVPLPPYIRREADEDDSVRYQTVYADSPGAVAAPTAGLHFTDEILGEIRRKGAGVCTLTLHTGPGTFLPVRAENVEEHRMLPEEYRIPEETAAAIRETKERGGRVFAVGTTTTRALEAAYAAGAGGPVLSGSADLFIYPGFRFRVVDCLLTNFHLPGSTLVMLVSAFAGRERILEAYRQAVELRYRFFSYGDAMLII